MGTVLSGVTSGALYAVVAIGLSLVFGVMNLVNVAHGDLVVVGGYLAAVAVTVTGMDPLLSLVIVVPLAFGLGWALQLGVLGALLRRGLEPPLVATFGLSLAIGGVLTLVFGSDPRSLPAPYALWGVPVAGTVVRFSEILVLGVAVVLVLGTHVVLTRTQAGAALRASAGDPGTAGTMGIDVRRVHAATVGTAASFAAVAGVLVGVSYSITPTSGAALLVTAFAVVVLGGTGGVLGTLVAGVALGLVQSTGGALLGGQYRDVIIYVAFVVLLVLRPSISALWSRRRRRATASARTRTVSA